MSDDPLEPIEIVKRLVLQSDIPKRIECSFTCDAVLEELRGLRAERDALEEANKLAFAGRDALKASNELLAAERDALRAEVKRETCAFFYWWYNQPGANTEQGYDQWVSEGKPGLEAQHDE